MPKTSPLRVRIVLAIFFIFSLLVFVAVYSVFRSLESDMTSYQKSLANSAVNLARLYTDIQHPGPWEARGSLLYKGGTRMSGSVEVRQGLAGYLPPEISILFGVGAPPVSLTQPKPPWWERFIPFRLKGGAAPMDQPPPDMPTYTASGALIGLRGADGAVVGWLYVSQQESPREDSQNSLFMFFIVVATVLGIIITIVLSAIVIRLSKPIDTIVEEHGREVRRNVELSRTSRTDPLTGLLNRRGFMDVVADERRGLSGNAFIAMFDIDHFKQVNDSRGHECGDAVLAEFARVLENGVRRHDYCVRWGGEEFLALLVGVDASTAELSAERLRSAVEQHTFECAGQAVPMTVTVGLARLDSLEELPKVVDRADKALYLGKQAGRNRVVLFGAPQ